MEWNLFSLKVFAEVVRQKSFTKAGKTLGLTQPAVSLQIQNLEKLMGCPLMIRKKTGGLTLTKPGEVLWLYTQKMTELLEDLERELQPWTSQRDGSVVVGCCCIAGEHIVPLYTTMFLKRHPQIALHCHVGRCKDIFSRLLDGSLDVAIAGIAPDDVRLVHHSFFHLPMTCFEIFGNASRRVSIKVLVREPLVLREEGSGTRRAFVRFLEQQGLTLDRCTIVATSESNEAVKEMVARGIGWSTLPSVVVQRELDQGRLSAIALEEGCPVHEFFVVYRKHRLFNGPQREFIHLLLDVAPDGLI